VSDVELAIRGGTVVDGTGAPARRADVGIRDGRVVAVEEQVRGRDEIDAAGRIVTPGFIDIHTHYDAQVLWDPELSPSSWQGVTTVVMGNCGFTLAPVRPEGRELLLRTLEQVEDMRLATMEAGITWDFESYGEYLDAIDRRRPQINVGGYVGHTAVRVYVMGDDAAERVATDEETARMVGLVRASLRDGALGFSTDRAGFIAGAGGKPLPSVVAAQAEVEALMAATAVERRGIVHLAPGDDYAWLYPFQRALGRTINWSSILAYAEGSTTRASYRTKLADHARGRATGADVVAQVTCRPIQQQITLLDPTPLSRIPAFSEVFERAHADRAALYADPEWRERAVRDIAASSVPMRWDAYEIAESSRHHALVGRTIAEIAHERGVPPLDALCDVALEDRLQTRFSVTFANDDPDAVRRLVTGDGCIIGLSDAGAHVSQICDAVLPTDFLARWVRDGEVMPLEAGIRKVTGELAAVLGIDRGVLAADRPADVLVLDYDALDPGPTTRVHDMPADGERLVAATPRGLDAVVVNGVPIRRDGVTAVAPRGAGEVLRSRPDRR
jgi:N-acyl-D-aspartate/D-glutamate deacylase